jgi:hypothetical protein
MNYHVKIFYLDGKDVSVILRKEDVNKFLACVKTNQPFWDDKLEGAFFSPTDHIRYVQVQGKSLEGAESEPIASDIKADGSESAERKDVAAPSPSK